MPWELMFTVLLFHLAPLTGPNPVSAALDASLMPVAPEPSVDSTADSVAIDSFSTPRTPFTVEFAGTENAYRVMAMFVLPGQSVPITVPSGHSLGPVDEYELVASQGQSVALGNDRWSWSAPVNPGLYPVEIRERRTGQTMTLNVFVMVPYSAMRHGSIQG